MTKHIGQLARVIDFLEKNGAPEDADMLRQARQNLHDSFIIIDDLIKTDKISPAKKHEDCCTTVGNLRAELHSFFDICM